MHNYTNEEKLNILARVSIVDVIGKRVKLVKIGNSMKGLCPFHAENNPSFYVNISGDYYKCFGCGKGGDVIDFVSKIENLSFNESLKFLDSSNLFLSEPLPPRPLKLPEHTAVFPIPNDAAIADFKHYTHGSPSSIYAFKSLMGELLGYSCRFETEGGKVVLPFTYRTSGKWAFKGFEAPRPAYGMENITYLGSKKILIVEGEKTRDSAQPQLNYAVISWHGGESAAHLVDWSFLSESECVYLFPDNDFGHEYTKPNHKAGQIKPFSEQPGNRCMLRIAEIITKLNPSIVIKWVTPLINTPCGWDLADRDWKKNELNTYIENHLSDVPYPSRIPIAPVVSPYVAPGIQTDSLPFLFLGFKKEVDFLKYYFLASASKMVLGFSNSSITKASIQMLAPINWWEDRYKYGKTIDMDSVAEFLSSESIKKGIFSELRIRGRGAWIDKGRSVLHVGDHLIVDGNRVELYNIDSKFIYEQAFPLGISNSEPATTDNTIKLLEIFSLMNWERPINSYLAAGWCVIAPICGALKWRPHTWVTGGAESGKTFILTLAKDLVGESGYFVEGDATAPGIRGLLNQDAMPIIFDEAEAEGVAAQIRIQSILELARTSSSENGAIVPKGSAGGGSVKISQVRSCFMFASIGMHLSQQSDRSRVTVLGLKAPSESVRKDRFQKLMAIHAELINDDFTSALRARTVKMMPIIRHNSAIFNKAAVSILGTQRHGDQLGSLLAGAVSLEYDGEITYEQALEWVSSKDWNEELSLDSSKDEIRLFTHIMEYRVNVETEYNMKLDRSIGELCLTSAQIATLGNPIAPEKAEQELTRWGISVRMVDGRYIIAIANQHSGLKKILRGTSWSADNHSRILERIPHSVGCEPFRFASSTSSAVGIPISLLA